MAPAGLARHATRSCVSGAAAAGLCLASLAAAGADQARWAAVLTGVVTALTGALARLPGTPWAAGAAITGGAGLTAGLGVPGSVAAALATGLGGWAAGPLLRRLGPLSPTTVAAAVLVGGAWAGVPGGVAALLGAGALSTGLRRYRQRAARAGLSRPARRRAGLSRTARPARRQAGLSRPG